MTATSRRSRRSGSLSNRREGLDPRVDEVVNLIFRQGASSTAEHLGEMYKDNKERHEVIKGVLDFLNNHGILKSKRPGVAQLRATYIKSFIEALPEIDRDALESFIGPVESSILPVLLANCTIERSTGAGATPLAPNGGRLKNVQGFGG